MLPEINSIRTSSPASKKRLLFIVTQSEMGGAQQFIVSLLGQLDKTRYDITVAAGAPPAGGAGGQLFNAVRRYGFEPIILDALRRKESPLQDMASVFSIRNLIRKLKPDTVFLGSSKAGFVGSLGARLSGHDCNVIYRIGGWSFNDPIPAWKKAAWRGLERLSAGWKDYIVVNNKHDFDQAKQFGIVPRKELRLIHNGIDPYKLEFLPREEARTALLNRIGKNIDPHRIVGTIANFYKTKGLVYLVDAAARVIDPGTVFFMIGDGEERPALERMIDEHRLQDRVFLLGQIPDASRYCSAFDVFVLPSLKEGFPWALLEAMAAKLPVVATRVGSTPEMIDDSVNGYLVEPRRSDQIADKLSLIFSNELKAKELGIQAHQKVLFSFTLDAMVSAVEQIL